MRTITLTLNDGYEINIAHTQKLEDDVTEALTSHQGVYSNVIEFSDVLGCKYVIYGCYIKLLEVRGNHMIDGCRDTVKGRPA